MIDLTPLQKLPKNVGDLGKLIVAKGFKNLPKVQKIARSGHTDYKRPFGVVCGESVLIFPCTEWHGFRSRLSTIHCQSKSSSKVEWTVALNFCSDALWGYVGHAQTCWSCHDVDGWNFLILPLYDVSGWMHASKNNACPFVLPYYMTLIANGQSLSYRCPWKWHSRFYQACTNVAIRQMTTGLLQKSIICQS